ncbi:hypothetical protein BX666DRAFT_1852800 [Dichotomocladium elegans]|nr:hypothetical protein BX666DRAFT_1852800 [Dichotomocladium elegans]
MNRQRSRQHTSKHDQYIDQLLTLFPGGDPGYFDSCLGYYDSSPVERIAEKIFSNGGYYPSQIKGKDKTQQMNHCLCILATEIFPDCNVSYIREKLLKYCHSYLEQVAEELIQEQHWPVRLECGGRVERCDMIKSETYKIQALQQLATDYPQVWKSSIRAVMAENNWDYIKSYDQLADMATGGFWANLRNFFRHWSVGSSSSGNATATTALDSELADDIKTIQQRALDAQVEQDHLIAQNINATEEYDALVACECCFGEYTLEQLVYCSTGEHTFCHECIQRFMSEGLFGQGTLRGVGRIPCIAMAGCCDGCFPTEMLRHVIPHDIWLAYERSLLDDCHMLPKMVRCQACGYGELDESIHTLNENVVTFALSVARWLLMVVIIIMLAVLHVFSVWSLNILLLLLLLCSSCILLGLQWDLKGDLEVVYDRIACERRGSVFRCRHPQCGKTTCLQCHRIICGLHKCWEKEQDGLRLYVEKAMADAVKRTVRKMTGDS